MILSCYNKIILLFNGGIMTIRTFFISNNVFIRSFCLTILIVTAFLSLPHAVQAQKPKLLGIERLDGKSTFLRELRFAATFTRPVAGVAYGWQNRVSLTIQPRFSVHSNVPLSNYTINATSTNGLSYDDRWFITVTLPPGSPAASIYITMDSTQGITTRGDEETVAETGSIFQSDTYDFDGTNTITVNTAEDSNAPVNDLVSLRSALTMAHTGGSTKSDGFIDKTKKVNIDLSPISGKTLVLTDRLPAIDKEIAISGLLQTPITIDGGNKHRIFFVRAGKLSLSNVILQNGRAKGGDGAMGGKSGGGGAGMGGAAFVNRDTELVCRNIQFIGNSAIGGTGGYGKSHDPGTGGGGGFYGSAQGHIGGSGGYLGDEGKGGNAGIGWYNHGGNGGFGGGGGATDFPVYGGSGGYGGGGGDVSGNGGSFGGRAWEVGGICVNRYNYAGGGAGLGGAIFVRENGKLSVNMCVFQNNQSIRGNVVFERCSGQGKGGAIFTQYNPIILDSVTFVSNVASNAGNSFVYGAAFQDNSDFYGTFRSLSPFVSSIVFDVSSNLSTREIPFIVTFDQSVTGVDVTDFDFDSDAWYDTRVSSFESIDAQTYRVILKKTRRAGYVTLKLIDDDSIRDSSGEYRLGQIGIGNGDFTGQRYDFLPIRFADSVLPLTGALKEYGVKIQNGIRLSVRDMNQNAYNKGYFIESTVIDNTSTSKSIQNIIGGEKARQDVFALIGCAVSTTTLKMAELCKQNQFPLFSPTATSSLLSDADYIAKIVPLDTYQIDALYKALHEYLGDEVFVIAEESEYGVGFLKLLQKEGIVSAGQYTFQSNALNVDNAIQSISQAFETFNPAIVIAAYEDDANQILCALAASNDAKLRNASILLTDAVTTPKTIEGLPEYDLLRYHPTVLGLTPIVPDSPSADHFASTYNALYGSKPEWISYYGYDALTAYGAAIQNAEQITRQGVWDAVAWLRFEGLTGTKTFDEKGNLYSAAYDLHYVEKGKWEKAETILVHQPEGDFAPNDPGAAKVVSYQSGLASTQDDFTYSLIASDPLISHLSGEQSHIFGWIAEPLDAPIGGVLMAYYEDIERGISTDNQPFVFQDGQTYYLTFNVLRESMTTEPPTEGDILDINVQSVYRYQNGDGVTHFARQDLINHTVTFIDWPDEGSTQITIPITYQSAAPDGAVINDEDNRFHWELKLLNVAKQKVLLTIVEIGTDVPTSVEDFMLY